MPSSGSCRPPSRATAGRPATRGTSTARRAAPPAARRPPWRPACCRWRTATTAAARCASRPRAAGLSASSRAAAASRAGPTSASRSSRPTACSPARSPRRRPCSTCSPATRSATPTWAPRPVEPYATSVRRDPGRLRVAMTAANVLDVDVDPECVRGMHAAGELLSSLGHEVETASPALPGGDPLDLFIEAFGPQVSLGIMYGQLLAGRAPEDDEIEPLSRAIFERAQQTALGRLPRRRGAAAGGRARARRLLRRVRPAAHPRARRAPRADRRDPRLRRGPDGRPQALRPLHAVHLAVERDRASRPSRSRSGSATTGCRPRRSSWPSRWARTRCSRWRRRWRRPSAAPSRSRSCSRRPGRRPSAAGGRRAARRRPCRWA